MVCEASRFASWVDANQERFAVHGSAFTVRGSPFTGAVRTSVTFWVRTSVTFIGPHCYSFSPLFLASADCYRYIVLKRSVPQEGWFSSDSRLTLQRCCDGAVRAPRYRIESLDARC